MTFDKPCGIPELDAAGDISLLGDVSLEDCRADYIKDVQEEYQRITGKLVTLPRGDKYRMTVDALALKLYQAELRRDFKFRMQFLKYAEGVYLDALGALWRLTRYPERAAQTTVRFKLSAIRSAPTVIHIGTKVRGEENQTFFVMERGEIPPGELFAECKCEALQPGRAGNGFKPGKINVLCNPLPYMEKIENITESNGGDDIESDDDFRWRIYYSNARFSTAGALDSYTYWARQYRSDLVVWPFSPAPSHDTVLALMENGDIPGPEIIQGLYAFLSAKDKRPLCDRLTVAAPLEVPYEINLTYYILADYATTEQQVQQAVERAIDEYIKWQRVIKRDITPGQLFRCLHEVPGFKRAAIAAPAADVIIDERSISKLVLRAVNYGGLEAE